MNWRQLILVAALIFPSLQAPAKIAKPELHGRWKMVAMNYRGQRIPPPNPHLHLFFEFTEVGLSRMFYWRDNENGFCENRSYYWFHEENSMLSQRVVWLNPANRAECAHDPDMRIHAASWTPVDIVEQELLMRVRLGDEDLIYIFQSVKSAH